LWSSAHNSFGVVVMMVKLRILSPAGERHVSHNPAMSISWRSARTMTLGYLPVAVFFHS